MQQPQRRERVIETVEPFVARPDLLPPLDGYAFVPPHDQAFTRQLGRELLITPFGHREVHEARPLLGQLQARDDQGLRGVDADRVERDLTLLPAPPSRRRRGDERPMIA